MQNITDLLFHPLSNAIMTILTGVTALYWITTFFWEIFLAMLVSTAILM